MFSSTACKKVIFFPFQFLAPDDDIFLNTGPMSNASAKRNILMHLKFSGLIISRSCMLHDFSDLNK